MQEMRRFPGANFPEFAAIHFGIRNLRVSTADKLARLPINQRFPSGRMEATSLSLPNCSAIAPLHNRIPSHLAGRLVVQSRITGRAIMPSLFEFGRSQTPVSYLRFSRIRLHFSFLQSIGKQ